MKVDDIKQKLKELKEMYGLKTSVTKNKLFINKPQFMGIDAGSIEGIDESKHTITIKTRPDIVDITLWKNVPASHISLFKLKKDLEEKVGV